MLTSPAWGCIYITYFVFNRGILTIFITPILGIFLGLNLMSFPVKVWAGGRREGAETWTGNCCVIRMISVYESVCFVWIGLPRGCPAQEGLAGSDLGWSGVEGGMLGIVVFKFSSI